MNRITELENLLRQASDAYYNTEKSILSDAEFDKLRDELEELDPKNAFLYEVGAASTGVLPKIKHNMPMGSLNKINTATELQTWRNSVPKGKVAVSLKLDGLSVEIVYKDGKFVQAVTRGDGNEGDDVTHTVKNAKHLPKTISVMGDVSVRCEAMLLLADWKKHFKDKSNPRNMVSGLVQRSDATDSEYIACVAFDVLFSGHPFKTEEDRVNWLKKEGFKAAPTEVIDLDFVEDAIDRIEKNREKLPVLIDGAVIKLNDIAAQDKLGEHKGRPYWARAWKFVAQGGHTIVTGVEWTVGTQGTITPVATVTPVVVAGVTISNVSLHNIRIVERLDVQIGDEVEVIRANDVIPQVVRVVKKGDTRKRLYCNGCPECGKKVVRDGKRLVCSDAGNCEGVVFKKISKWIKKRRILYLGDSTLRLLVDDGVVKSVPDLYLLTTASMVAAGVGAGDAKRILPQIEKSKNCSLADLIGSLSLDKLGRSEASNLIALRVDTLDKWKNVTAAQIEAFPGFHGGVKANAIAVAVEKNWDLIRTVAKYLNNGNQPPVSTKPVIKVSGKLNNDSFCFTGTMSKPRTYFEQLAADAGGEVHNRVTGALNYLVVPDINWTSSKTKKADKADAEMITEDEFIKMLGQ